MKKTADVIIQARMGSSRMPGKVLKKVKGLSLLANLVGRVRKSFFIDRVVVATTTLSCDDPIVNEAENLGVDCFRGETTDVLARFWRAAQFYEMSNIVRITADCPLLDGETVDRVVKCFFQTGADYCSNILKRSFPDGFDVEVFTFAALNTAHDFSKSAHEREHVTPFIRSHPELFCLKNVKMNTDLSNLRLTVDYPEDFRVLSAIIENFSSKKKTFTLADILSFLSESPQILTWNWDRVQNPSQSLTELIETIQMSRREVCGS